MFEGKKHLPIDFKMACALRNTEIKKMNEINAKRKDSDNNNEFNGFNNNWEQNTYIDARAKYQIYQHFCSLLCPSHEWKEIFEDDDLEFPINNGNKVLVERTCKICGGKEDGMGEPLDWYLKSLYERSCDNCGWYDHHGDPSVGIGPGCECEDMPEDNVKYEKVMDEIKKGKNCPYWR